MAPNWSTKTLMDAWIAPANSSFEDCCPAAKSIFAFDSGIGDTPRVWRWIILLSVACDLTQPDAYRALEKRVAALEQSATAEEQARDRRQRAMIACVQRSEDAYWEYVRLNGGKLVRSDGDNKVYRASESTWDKASRKRALALEECKALWK